MLNHPMPNELGGLTKRDYVAARAAQGLLAGGYCSDDHKSRAKNVASESVCIADALLAELEKTE